MLTSARLLDLQSRRISLPFMASRASDVVQQATTQTRAIGKQRISSPPLSPFIATTGRAIAPGQLDENLSAEASRAAQQLNWILRWILSDSRSPGKATLRDRCASHKRP